MPSELYEVLAQGARYWFLFLMALIVWRSYRWYRRDRRQTRKRLKLLPDAGYVGELVVTHGAGALQAGDVIAVPREGTLGALRTNDVCIPAPGVARRHLWFRYDQGKGLMVEPMRGERFSVDGEPVSPKRAPHMAHGSRLTVGEVELRLRMFAGFESVAAPRAATRASAARLPDDSPMPDAAAQSAALYQWMMLQYAQQQGAPTGAAGGYAQQGGYVPANGYPVQDGGVSQGEYAPANAYPANGYPMQDGGASQGEYDMRSGYNAQGGYAPANAYPANGYPMQDGGASQGEYAMRSGYDAQGGYTPTNAYPANGYPMQDGGASQGEYAMRSGYDAQGGYAPANAYPTQDGDPLDFPNLDALTPEEALAYATRLPPAQAERFADAYATHYAAQSIANPTYPRAHTPFMRPADQPSPEWLRAMRDSGSTAPTELPATPQADSSAHAPHVDESFAPDGRNEADEASTAYYAPEADDDAFFYGAAYNPNDYDEDMTDAAAPPRSAYIGHDESERAKRRVWDKYFGGHA